MCLRVGSPLCAPEGRRERMTRYRRGQVSDWVCPSITQDKKQLRLSVKFMFFLPQHPSHPSTPHYFLHVLAPWPSSAWHGFSSVGAQPGTPLRPPSLFTVLAATLLMESHLWSLLSCEIALICLSSSLRAASPTSCCLKGVVEQSKVKTPSLSWPHPHSPTPPPAPLLLSWGAHLPPHSWLALWGLEAALSWGWSFPHPSQAKEQRSCPPPSHRLVPPESRL